MNITTLFSGGEGIGTGAEAAGLSHLSGIEDNDAIAQVARDNDFNVITADILKTNPNSFARPDVLHASPPCPSFSVAKQGRRETEHDLDLAWATAGFIEALLPKIFTLENVYLYRKSQSWSIIAETLNRCGYQFDLAHINAADFGVPQTRKRMWVRAIRGQTVPRLPPPEPWVGWYEAIEDLVPTLPESKLAPWQLAGLKLAGTTLIDSAGYLDKNKVRIPVTRRGNEPANTIIANHARRPMRAFLVGGQYGRPANKDRGPRPPQTRQRDAPAFTVTAVNKGDWRAWLSQGRVVQMTPRALARFQAFPDDYQLPKQKTLACRVIGNAAPPLLYQKLVERLLQAIS